MNSDRESIEGRFLCSLSDGTRRQLETARVSTAAVARAGLLIEEGMRGGRKLLLFGNGGSAADAQHVAAEFVGRFALERRALPAIALTTDTSALTAIGNDFGFERVFARQVEALGVPGDVAVAISTSGSSPNAVAAVLAARNNGMRTIALVGGRGGELEDLVDVALVVPASETPRVQEGHLLIEHALCEGVEALLESEPIDPATDGAVGLLVASEAKVLALEALLARRESWREERRRVVWTNGCFDLLHVGHVQSLEAARRLGDVLVVGVNDDASVRRLKGPERPILPAAERAALVGALEAVGAVTTFGDDDPRSVLAALQPEIHCKGADYQPPHGKPIPELDVVESYGGRVAFLPLVPARSSTDLVERITGGMAADGEK